MSSLLICIGLFIFIFCTSVGVGWACQKITHFKHVNLYSSYFYLVLLASMLGTALLD